MAYSFTITELTPVVTLTEVTSVFTVTDVNYSFTVTQPPASVFTVSNSLFTFTATTNMSQVRTENMATAFKGEFVGGTTYYRGHIVRYNQAIYVAQIGPGETITSAVAPPSNSQWQLVFSQQGLTATQVTAMERALHLGLWSTSTSYQVNDWVYGGPYNNIYVLTTSSGSLGQAPDTHPQYWQNVGGGIGGDVYFHNLTVTNQLTVAGVKYPTNNGNLGQVLATNGENQASWVDVGSLAQTTATHSQLGSIKIGLGLSADPDGTLNVTSASQYLRYWSLYDDLKTNGFNIVTHAPDVIGPNFPVPQLSIGSGKTGSLDAALIFDQRTDSNSSARLVADTLRLFSGNATSTASNTEVKLSVSGIDIKGPVTFHDGNILLGSNVYGLTTNAALNIAAPNVNFSGNITGSDNTDPVQLGSGGVRFPDDTVQTTAAVAPTPYVLVTATTTRLGGIKIGAGLNVLGDGTVSVNTSTPVGNLVPATANSIGGVTIGSNINIENTLTGLISVSTASASTLGVAKFGLGLTVSNGAVSLNTASQTQLGGIKTSSDFKIDGSGVLSLSTTTFNVDAATTSTLGGVKIDNDNKSTYGVVITDGRLSLNLAGENVLGGVNGSGAGITISGGQVNLDTASDSALGGVKIGTGLVMSGQYAQVRPATTSSLGGIIVGENLVIDQYGKLDVVSNTIESGLVSLTRDAYTNFYKIKPSQGNTNTWITVDNLKINALVNNQGLTITNSVSELNFGNNKFAASGDNVLLQYGSLVQSVVVNSTGTGLYSNNGSLVITNDSLSFQDGTNELTVNDNQVIVKTGSNGLSVDSGSAQLLGPGSSSLTLTNGTAEINSGAAHGGYFSLSNDHSVMRQSIANIITDLVSEVYVGTASTRLVFRDSQGVFINTMTLTIAHNVKTNIQSPDTQFGSQYDSRIYVGAIYNYAGTGAPLFPEGIQFSDLTVQQSAFQGYDFGSLG